MILTLEMELDDDAFSEEDFADEIKICLRNVSLKIERGLMEGLVIDNNSNTVGTFEIE